MRRIFIGITFLFCAVFLTAGCKAQAPVKLHYAQLSWTNKCTSSQTCTFIISSLVVSSTTSNCPTSTGSNYTPLNLSNPVSGTTYQDTTAAGAGPTCYVAQATDGTSTSNASAPTSAPISVPANPLAPVVNQPTVASGSKENEFPQVHPALQDSSPQLAKLVGPGFNLSVSAQ